jgi:hypothetical protein
MPDRVQSTSAVRKLKGEDGEVIPALPCRRIGGLEVKLPKRDEATGEWRRLHNEELNDLYSSPNISGNQIEKNELGGTCSTYEGKEGCIQGFGGETRRKATTWETQA